MPDTTEKKEPQETEKKDSSYLDVLTDGIMEIPFRIGQSIVTFVKSDNDNTATESVSTDNDVDTENPLPHIFDSAPDTLDDSAIEPSANVVIEAASTVARGVGEAVGDIIDNLDI